MCRFARHPLSGKPTLAQDAARHRAAATEGEQNIQVSAYKLVGSILLALLAVFLESRSGFIMFAMIDYIGKY